MPVRNAAPFLDASVTSILRQTKRDFEFVIVDDASTDGTTEILRAWAAKDARIRLVRSETPLGVVGAADRAMREARGTICARMDADDACAPTRLAEQWAALESRPDAALVGTLWCGIDPSGRRVRPSDRWRLWRDSTFAPFPHGSIMFRRDWALTIGGYRAACAGWEDLDFYIRLASVGAIYVIPRALYSYRFHTTMETATRAVRTVERMYQCTDRVRAGEDYNALLQAAPDGDVGAERDPRAIRSLTAPRLWAGERPGIPAVWTSRAAWRPISAAVHTLVLGTWGELSPKTLRSALSALIRSRDALAGLWINGDAPVRWNPRPDPAMSAVPALAPGALGK